MPAGDATPGTHPPQRANDDPTWSQWMALAQQGDRATYQRLLQAIVPYLSAIARRHLVRGDDVEDAVQDILMILHGVRHTYEPGRPLKPWLSTIARRHCVDMTRRRLRQLRRESDDETALATIASDEPTPDHALRQAQTSVGIRSAVAALPPRQRTALELLKLDELSLREASAASGLSIPALKVACHRAIKSLRRNMGVGEGNDD